MDTRSSSSGHQLTFRAQRSRFNNTSGFGSANDSDQPLSPAPTTVNNPPVLPIPFQSRKSLPIKKQDAEPLTREDIQYDFLYDIFADNRAVFTNPRPTPGKPIAKVTFRDLYISALYNSSKCSKVLKDKMAETPAFAVELAKISLLTNVGRINTTMAFFPEMKTALRTYHAIPSLQKTDGNAQDAPRIKNCLKYALLPAELKGVPPSSPAELKERQQTGKIPSTSVVNLVFILSVHAATLAPVHFTKDGSINFLEIFLPRPLSSPDRARVFLWHMYHYLESPASANPYDDDFSRTHPDKAPRIRQLSAEEAARENVDTSPETEWGKKMTEQRNLFLRKLVNSQEYEKRNKAGPQASSSSVTDFSTFRKTYPTPGQHDEQRGGRETFMYYIPPLEKSTSAPDPMIPHSSRHHDEPASLSARQERSRTPPSHRYRYPQIIPPPPPPDEDDDDIQLTSQAEYVATTNRTQKHSMVKHAWYLINHTDPLLDSDDEIADGDSRIDYRQRTKVLTRVLKYGR